MTTVPYLDINLHISIGLKPISPTVLYPFRVETFPFWLNTLLSSFRYTTLRAQDTEPERESIFHPKQP